MLIKKWPYPISEQSCQALNFTDKKKEIWCLSDFSMNPTQILLKG